MPTMSEILRPGDPEAGTPIDLNIIKPYEQQILLNAISRELKELTHIDVTGSLYTDGKLKLEYLRRIAKSIIQVLPERGRPNPLELVQMGLPEFTTKEQLEELMHEFTADGPYPHRQLNKIARHFLDQKIAIDEAV